MIAAGWSPSRVQAELGDSDPPFTLRVCGHLWPDEIDSGRQALDALLTRRGGRDLDDATAGMAANLHG
jgi:hypothetical protein